MKICQKLVVVAIIAGLAFSFYPELLQDVVVNRPRVNNELEVCEVVAHDQTVPHSHGIVHVAIIKRGNGELRSVYLDSSVDGFQHVGGSGVKLPASAHYAYVSGLEVPGAQPTSVIPIFSE